jgi:ferritin-like metal-binding protein YciE
MSINQPEDLLIHELKAIQNAETEAAEALKSLSQQVESDGLRKLLGERLRQGEMVLRETEKALERLGDEGKASTVNSAARGIIRDSEVLLNQISSPELKQAALIGGVQKLEHYCIAAWGTVKAIAAEAGEQELTDAMQKALDEGYRWDQELTKLAEARINPEGFEE